MFKWVSPGFLSFLNSAVFPFLVGVFVVLNIWVYWPALAHPAKSDHMIWLLEMAPYDSWLQTWMNCFSFCRTRNFNTGDELLFRPLLYLWMSVQKDLFEYRFYLWQMTSLILHISVFLMVVRVIRIFSKDCLWVVAAGFFSLLFFYFEMVIWHHISGYLLAFVLILWAIDMYFRQFERSTIDIRWIVVLLTITTFIFEYACFVGMVMALSLWLNPHFKRSCFFKKMDLLLLAFVPLFLYGGCSLLDLFLRGGLGAGEFSGTFNFLGALSNFLNIFRLYLLVPWFSFSWNINLGERVFLGYPDWFQSLQNPFFQVLQFSFLMVFLALLGILMLFWMKRKIYLLQRRQIKSVQISAACFWTLSVMLYVSMIAMGRVDEKSMLYIRFSLYHFYYLWFLTLPAIVVFCSFWRIEDNFSKRIISFLLLFSLTIGVFLNGFCIRRENLVWKNFSSPWAECVRAVQEFVDSHRKEPDFSFQIFANDTPLIADLFWGRTEDRRSFFTEYTREFFQKYSREERSRYFIVYSRSDGLVVFDSLLKAEEYVKKDSRWWFFSGSVIRKR